MTERNKEKIERNGRQVELLGHDGRERKRERNKACMYNPRKKESTNDAA